MNPSVKRAGRVALSLVVLFGPIAFGLAIAACGSEYNSNDDASDAGAYNRTPQTMICRFKRPCEPNTVDAGAQGDH